MIEQKDVCRGVWKPAKSPSYMLSQLQKKSQNWEYEEVAKNMLLRDKNKIWTKPPNESVKSMKVVASRDSKWGEFSMELIFAKPSRAMPL